MKATSVIFLIIYFMYINSAESTKDTRTLKQSKQHIKPGNMYDYFHKRFENIQNNYDENKSHQGNNQKRTLNGKYVPLYDEFKKRLDNFKSVLLLDKDQPLLAQENSQNLVEDSFELANIKTNVKDDMMMERSNRGFLKYFGIKKNSKENHKVKSKTSRHDNKEKKGKQLSRENLNLVGIKPGNFYEEYWRQIEKTLS